MLYHHVARQDGIEYHFVEKPAILTAINKHEFIEHAEVHGNVYGTSYASVEAVQLSGSPLSGTVPLRHSPCLLCLHSPALSVSD